MIRGQLKGMIGLVVEATDTYVEVELQSKMKNIVVDKTQVCTVEPSLFACCNHLLLAVIYSACSARVVRVFVFFPVDFIDSLISTLLILPVVYSTGPLVRKYANFFILAGTGD